MKVILSVAFLGLVAIASAKEYKCPETSEGQNEALIPNIDDCSTFFICINGYPILTGCPVDYLFDINALSCLPKNEAKCAEDESIPVEPTPEVPCVKCPPQTSIDDNILLPNIKNCSTFYQCSYGVPILQACPPNLHFNNKKKYCDYPGIAGCVESETC